MIGLVIPNEVRDLYCECAIIRNTKVLQYASSVWHDRYPLFYICKLIYCVQRNRDDLI
jgi:hypothetical protein